MNRFVFGWVLYLALGVAGSGWGAEIVWTNSYGGALKLAQEQKRHLLIDFYSDQCSWCLKLDRDVFQHPRGVERLKGLVCLKINVNRDARTAAAFQISSIPRTVIIDPEGRVSADRLGYQPLDEFLLFLDDALKPPVRPGLRQEAPGIGALRDLGAVRAAVTAERQGAVFSESFLASLGHADPAIRAEARRGVREAGAVFRPHLLEALGHADLGVRISAWQLLKDLSGPGVSFDPWAPAAERETRRRAMAGGTP